MDNRLLQRNIVGEIHELSPLRKLGIGDFLLFAWKASAKIREICGKNTKNKAFLEI